MKLRPLLFSVLVISFAATGCLFSPDNGGENPPVVTTTYIWPDTADKLVANFEIYYGDRNLARYAELLSGNYRFIAQDGTEYNFDREYEIADKMFNEVAGDDGIAFEDITVEYLNPLAGQWVDADQSPTIPTSGASRAVSTGPTTCSSASRWRVRTSPSRSPAW